MSNTKMNLSDIGGVELSNRQKSQLTGGDELPGVFCISCKDSDWEFLGNVEYGGVEDWDAMRQHCRDEGYPATENIAYTRNPCDPQ